MSWPLLLVPITSAHLPFHASLSSYWLEWMTVPRKFFRVRVSGTTGMLLAAVAMTTWRGHRCGAGPVVKLLAFDVGSNQLAILAPGLKSGRPARRVGGRATQRQDDQHARQHTRDASSHVSRL